MKTSHCFSFRFDSNFLLEDLSRTQKEWTNHFNTNYYQGEWSGIPLRQPTESFHPLNTGNQQLEYTNAPILEQLPYFRSVIDFFKCPVTSVRLLKLAAGAAIKEHRDPDLSFWNNLVRIHVPIVTNTNIMFLVDNKMLKMLPGECWFAEFCLPHSVKNGGDVDRIHLVIDLKVNKWLRDLFEKEGILEENETAPDPLEKYSIETKLQMYDALINVGTKTSKALARQLAEKYHLYT